jgi:hypothetical protein
MTVFGFSCSYRPVSKEMGKSVKEVSMLMGCTSEVGERRWVSAHGQEFGVASSRFASGL